MENRNLIHELIEMLERTDTYEFEKTKGQLIKLAKMSALSFGEDEKHLTDDEIQSIYKTYMIPFRNEAMAKEIEVAIRRLNKALMDALFVLADGIKDRGYQEDAVELLTEALRGMGGKPRWIMRRMIERATESTFVYEESEAYYQNLKLDLARQINIRTVESMFVASVHLNGLLTLVKEHLEQTLQNLGTTIRAKVLLDQDLVQRAQPASTQNCKFAEKILDVAYTKELRRRIYAWDKLTVELRHEYSVDALLENQELDV